MSMNFHLPQRKSLPAAVAKQLVFGETMYNTHFANFIQKIHLNQSDGAATFRKRDFRVCT